MKIQLAIIQTAILSLVFLFAPKSVSAQEIPSPANITSSDLQGRFGGYWYGLGTALRLGRKRNSIADEPWWLD